MSPDASSVGLPAYLTPAHQERVSFPSPLRGEGSEAKQSGDKKSKAVSF